MRWFAYTFSIMVTAMCFGPGLIPGVKDSFPLSTYPMFSRARGKPVIEKLIGIQKDGTQIALPPWVVGTEEIMQAVVTIRNAVWRRQASQLCKQVAIKLKNSTKLSSVVEVRVVGAQYDPIKYFEDNTTHT